MQRVVRSSLILTFLATVLGGAGCSSAHNDGNSNKDAGLAAGGISAAGGALAAGGAPAAGGTSAAGGALAAGGTPAAGGTSAAGGIPIAGGSLAAGGSSLFASGGAGASKPDAGDAAKPDAPADTRPTVDGGNVVKLDAPVVPGSGTVLESSVLRLEVTASPYSYKVTEKSSGEVLVSQSGSTLTVGGTASASTSASGFATSATTLDANLALSGSNTAHVKFTFTSPEVLQVIVSTTSGTATNVKEQFNDQNEHYYGIWGYHLGTSGNLDNRGADHDLLGLQTNSDINYSSARAPFYLTSKKYGIYAESMAKGHYTIAVGGKTSFNFDSPQLQYDIIYGPTYADVLGRYNTLAGPSFMPPTWAFDSIWWRDDHHDDWSAQGVASSQALVIKDADNLRLNQIPASAIWIDRPLGQHGFRQDIPRSRANDHGPQYPGNEADPLDRQSVLQSASDRSAGQQVQLRCQHLHHLAGRGSEDHQGL
jgi:hypothetical protein